MSKGDSCFFLIAIHGMISLRMLKHSHNKEYGAGTEFGWDYRTDCIGVQLKQVITVLLLLIVLQNH